MTDSQFLRLQTIDRMIFGFVILFVISLTNSIFLNQIGYFGALLLIGLRFSITRKNQFTRNGLELAFLLFLAAELISALLSIDKAHAFQNFMKRLILVPIVYTIVHVADDKKKGELLLKFYLGAALITMIVYIIFAYEHFIARLYQLELKGPSPFQYVMTAGGLMSFSAIFFFALFVNEKTKLIYKLFYFSALAISIAGLIASFTRAAWLGAAAGILLIILIKRKWSFIIPIFVLLLFIIIFQKNESKIYNYSVKENELVQRSIDVTKGRASSVLVSGNIKIVADYEKGILAFENEKLIQNIPTVAPVLMVTHWKENYFIAYLLDSRILVLEKNIEGKLKTITTFTSPGNTKSVKVFNNILFIADQDSGLTIYKNPIRPNERIRIKEFEGITQFGMSDSLFAAYFRNKNLLKIFLVKNFLPDKILDSVKVDASVGLHWIKNSQLFFQSDQNLIQFETQVGKLVKRNIFDAKGIFKMQSVGSLIYASTVNGNIYKLIMLDNSNYKLERFAELGYSITDLFIDGDNLFAASVKRNRFATIFDPYHETNYERLNIWRIGFKIFSDHPLFGVGDIDLQRVYERYKDYFLKENFGHMHNNYVHFLVILGVFGFAAAMFLLLKVLQLHIKIYNAVKNEPLISSFALGSLSAFVGFLFSGLGEWNFGDQEIITLVWFTLGLNIAFYKNTSLNSMRK